MSKAGNYIVAAAYFVAGWYTGNPSYYYQGAAILSAPAIDGRHRERAAAKAARIEARARGGQVVRP